MSEVVVRRRVVEGEAVAGGVLLVEVDCGCGWKALRRVLSIAGCRWCLIANVVEGVACVAYRAI